MTELWKWENKNSTNLLNTVHVLALLCSVFVFLSSFALEVTDGNKWVYIPGILVLLFNFTIAGISIYKSKEVKLPSFSTELLLTVNAGILLIQLLIGKFTPQLAYYTLFVVYFIGQFSWNSSFNRYYPLLVLATWYLILLIAKPVHLNSILLLFVAMIMSCILYIINFSRGDISSRLEKKEKALTESDELFENMFSNSPVGTAIINDNLQFDQVNNALSLLVGYHPDKLLQMSLPDLVTDETAYVDQELLKNMFRGKLSHFKDKRQIINKDGTLSWVNLSLTTIKDEESEAIQSVMMIAEDITAEVSKYDKLKDLTEQVHNFEDQLKTYHKAHNYHLVNPVRDIKQYLDWVKEQYLTPDKQPLYDSMDYLIEKVKHVENMINDLGEYSKVDYRTLVLKSVDVEDTVEYVLKKIDPVIREKNAIIHYEQLPFIITDENYLTDIFEELLLNATEHCRDKVPIIKIQTTEEPDNWVFGVSDNGPGIDEVLKETIFDIFVRGNEISKGTGMGLSLVKKMVEKLGGEIWLKSGTNLGSTIYFSIPKRKIIDSIPR